MRERIISYLGKITQEEQAILDGNLEIQRELYTSDPEFIVDSKKLLAKGKLIDVRPHTRFVYFPVHRHNYIEVLYVIQGSWSPLLMGRNVLPCRQVIFYF